MYSSGKILILNFYFKLSVFPEAHHVSEITRNIFYFSNYLKIGTNRRKL